MFKFLIFTIILFHNTSFANYWWETEKPDYLDVNHLKNVKIIHDISYGKNKRQTFDVYIPNVKKLNSPVLFLVHGGAWMSGDKASSKMVVNKVNYWGSKGFVVISTNYRLAPAVSVSEQLLDVIAAINKAQSQADTWGADKNKFVLIGHSSGGHLISTIRLNDLSVKPAGIIGVDVAGFNIEEIMKQNHQKFYDFAFPNSSEWRNISPQTKSAPFNYLLLCSKQSNLWCKQGVIFSDTVIKNGGTSEQTIFNLNHSEINETLGGENNPQTKKINNFLNFLNLIH